MPGMVDFLRLGADAAAAKVLCIFVHGRNQTPEDMQAAVVRHLATPDVALALPRAGDRCWYRALAVDPLTDGTRAELAASLAGLDGLVARLRDEGQGRPLVIAGFSQGACLALEHAFASRAAADAVVALTGCRVGRATDDRPRAIAPGLPVYLSGGSADPWIPVAAMAEALAELGTAGATLRADVFPGRPHEVSQAEIAMLDGVLADLAAGAAPSFGVPR